MLHTAAYSESGAPARSARHIYTHVYGTAVAYTVSSLLSRLLIQ